MMQPSLCILASSYAARHADADGFAATPLPGVSLMRAIAPGGITHSIYKPIVCLILQGSKEVTIGTHTHLFTAGQSALINAELPFLSRVTSASTTAPYVALAIELDIGVLQEFFTDFDPVDRHDSGESILVEPTDAETADCALRLLGLLDRPEAAKALQASILRELHYWLQAGRHGRMIRGIATPGSSAHKIARAVAVVRGEFDQPLRVEGLALAAGMSPSSFHQHFRRFTSLSPIQFQKQVRLIEARRRMLRDGIAASEAAFQVGYGSVSQFTREYGRLFGLPPGRDRVGARLATTKHGTPLEIHQPPLPRFAGNHPRRL